MMPPPADDAAGRWDMRRRLHHSLWTERGGRDGELLILLHGLGANAAVWHRLLPIVEADWPGRWLAPDFRGHGRSPHVPPYSYGANAADIAALIADEPPFSVAVIGHSFGGVVAAMLGSGWFGPQVRSVAAFGVKTIWTEQDIAKAQALARRPVQTFATRAEAVERALKIAGLFGLMDPESPEAGAGVVEADDHWRIAMDPRCFGAVGPSIVDILRSSLAPLRLAGGEGDPMISIDSLRSIDPQAAVIENAGHNPHWEAPEKLWRFIRAAF
jgi:pimeloyl-ACP methyl ester carboxylesterase